MVAAQTGDQQAYAKLLAEITPLLTHFMRRRLPENLVEDTVQETLISLHKARATYSSKSPFHNWLFAIARHRMVDALRKNGRASLHINLDEVETFLADETNVFEERDTSRLLAKALKELNARQRKVVTMMKVEGYTIEEVAKATGLSPSNVKVTAHRAYKILREILER